MAIPEVYDLTLPFLKHIDSGEEFHIHNMVKALSEKFSLTDEELQTRYEKSRDLIFKDRVSWARMHLKWSGFVEPTGHGYVCITQEGKKLLSEPPDKIDYNFMKKLPVYFQNKRNPKIKKSEIKTDENATEILSNQTPQKLMDAAQDQQERAVAAEILDKVRGIDPKDFEHLILALLKKMGYGETQHLGGSGDKGVDGVIEQDKLGLDRVYIQAKRYQEGSSVGPETIQAFSGSLNMHRVQKGLFVTSSSFSSKAREAAQKLTQNIVVIDGEELAQLMIDHNVGVRVKTAYEFKDIDEDFFENL